MAKVTHKPGPTSEQLDRLTAIEGKLLDVACDECDPDGWINQEKADARAREIDMEADLAEANGDKALAKILRSEAKQVRYAWKGERYWEKKNANQTLALITRIVTYRQRLEESRAGEGLGDDEATLAADMKAAEKKVKGRLALVKKRAS
jgi:hypothetical protein